MNRKKLLAIIFLAALLGGCSPDHYLNTVNKARDSLEIKSTVQKTTEPADKTFSFCPPQTTNLAVLSVSGQASPDSMVWIDNQQQIMDTCGHFTARLELEEGSNIIPVKVSTPNSRYLGSVKIEYKPQLEEPKISLDLKDQYSYSHIIFKGITGRGNAVTINKRPVIIQENGEFISDIFLVQGTHIIDVVVTNSSKMTTTLQKVVKVVYPVKKPSLIVSLPQEPGFVSTDQIEIKGFTDRYNIIEVYNNFFNSNGKNVLSMVTQASVDSKGVFVRQIPLNPGPNHLIIRAIDPNGNINETTRKIYCKNNYDRSWNIPKGSGYGYDSPDMDILNQKYKQHYDKVDQEDK